MLQMLYSISDMGVAAEVIDSRAFSAFCGVTSSNQVPNGDTIGRFRNILIKSNLRQVLFDDVVQRLKEKNLLLMKGTIVDSTLISSPQLHQDQEKETRSGSTSPGLLEEIEDEVYGDSGYTGIEKREETQHINQSGNEIHYMICARPSSLKKSLACENVRAIEHLKSSVRCKTEHVFAVVKGQFLFKKTRLRGLEKVDAQLHMSFALVNLLLAARPSLAA